MEKRLDAICTGSYRIKIICNKGEHFSIIFRSGGPVCCVVGITSRKVIWLFLEQLWSEFVPVFHRLQGRFAAQC